jgi:hypothetical protein
MLGEDDPKRTPDAPRHRNEFSVQAATVTGTPHSFGLLDQTPMWLRGDAHWLDAGDRGVDALARPWCRNLLLFAFG